MRFDQGGRLIAGNEGPRADDPDSGVVSIDGRKLARGNAARPLGGGRVVYQNIRNQVAIGQFSGAEVLEAVIDPPMGANEIAGSDVGRFAAWLASDGAVRTSDGRRFPGDGLADMAPDGSLLLVDRRAGAALQFEDGAPEVVPGGIRSARAIARGHWVASTFARSIISSRLGVAAIPAGVTPFGVAMQPDSNGVWWLLYHTHRHLILQRFDAPIGRVLVSNRDTFAPDLLVKGTTAHVGYATAEGERPGDVRRLSAIAVETLTDDLRGVTDAGQQPPVDPPVIPPKGDDPPAEGGEPVALRKYLPIPAIVIANIKDMIARHRDLIEGSDEDRRKLNVWTCEQNCFDLGPKYGAKRADPGRPTSKDAQAVLGDDGLCYFADVVNGTDRDYNGATQYCTLGPEENAGYQVFQAVDPVDHLGHGKAGGGSTGGGSTGGDVPPKGDTSDAVLAAIRAVLDLAERNERRIAEVARRVEELAAKMPAADDGGTRKLLDMLIAKLKQELVTSKSMYHVHGVTPLYPEWPDQESRR